MFARDWIGRVLMGMASAWCIFLCRDLCEDPDRCARHCLSDMGIDPAMISEQSGLTVVPQLPEQQKKLSGKKKQRSRH
eukprot:SAG31_NODE_11423_length_1032_cov_1.372990_2_plen_78_part_00